MTAAACGVCVTVRPQSQHRPSKPGAKDGPTVHLQRVLDGVHEGPEAARLARRVVLVAVSPRAALVCRPRGAEALPQVVDSWVWHGPAALPSQSINLLPYIIIIKDKKPTSVSRAQYGTITTQCDTPSTR